MIKNRNVNIITDADGKKLVLINDIRFKGKRQIDWDDVRFALPVYEENVLVRYNIFHARLLVNHAENGSSVLSSPVFDFFNIPCVGFFQNTAIGICNTMGELCSPLTTS